MDIEDKIPKYWFKTTVEWFENRRRLLWVIFLLGVALFVLYVLDERITTDNLPSVLDAVAWPFAVVAACYLLRGIIANLLARLEKLIWGDKSAKFLPWAEHERAAAPQETPLSVESDSDDDRAEKNVQSARVDHANADSPSIDPEKVANIYWIGSDLVNVVNLAMGGASRDKIAWQLRQANHHMTEVGMTGSAIQMRLQRITDETAISLEKDWTPQRRTEVAKEAFSVMTAFGKEVQRYQPGFDWRPKTSEV